MEDVMLSSISGFGFPAILCFYLVFKINGTLEKLTEAINMLSKDVEKRDVETQNRLSKLEDIVSKLERRRSVQ